MRKIWKSSALLLGTAMLGAIALSGTNARAVDVTVPVSATIQQSILAEKTGDFTFGTIEFAPGAESTITVDASAGPVAGAPDISGASLCPAVTSGQITVTAPFPIDIVVTIPNTLTLKNAAFETITLSDIQANSTPLAADTNILKHVADVPTRINLGGKLTLPTTTKNGSYTNDLKVTLAYQ